PLHEPLWF
ncbi:D12 class N6 adenine-specific DNA methyltransferase family protein, partial [Vibrio parahaemolyticus EKP-028]